MTKIRESLSTVFAVFAGMFVVYIVLDWGMDITGRKSRGMTTMESQEIGSINGDIIMQQDFAELIKQYAENQKAQSGTEPDESQIRMLRDQAWNDMVEEKLYDEQIKKLGITVTDQEIIDWTWGANPPEFLKRQFTDSLGSFNEQAYQSAIKNPKNKAVWVRVEDILRKQRKREKLQSMVLASVRVSESDVQQKFIDQNVQFVGEYALLDPNAFVKDDDSKSTEDDLRRYYNSHSDEFKQEATRKLKYVMFSETASKSDTDAVLADLNDIVRRAKEGTDFAELAKTYSEIPVAEAFMKHGELSQDRENAVYAAKKGEVVGPIKDFDGYHVIKVIDFRTGKDDFVKASHILISIQNNDSAFALKEAKSIFAKAKRGEDFATLAKHFSRDPSGAKGGDLGWFGKGRMVKEFEQAANKAGLGQIVGPVKTQFGYHIIKVTARDKREVKVADIKLSVKVSGQTRDALNQQAQDFAYLVKKSDLVKEAAGLGYKISETPVFQKSAVIPGVGLNASLNKFAFNEKVGSVTDCIYLQNGYGVFMISEVKEAGIRPFEELKQSLEGRVKREKKMEKLKTIAQEMRQSLSATDSLMKLKEKNPTMNVQRLTPFTLGGVIPGLGRDPAFTGGISNLQIGETSKPIESTRGYYIIRLISKSPFDSMTYNSQKEALRAQLLRDERNRFYSEWVDHLKKSADIVDNRDSFYR